MDSNDETFRMKMKCIKILKPLLHHNPPLYCLCSVCFKQLAFCQNTAKYTASFRASKRAKHDPENAYFGAFWQNDYCLEETERDGVFKKKMLQFFFPAMKSLEFYLATATIY